MAFLPWPQALRAELELLDGDPGKAAESLERAWSLATQLGDPCWEGMAARGLGLLHAQRGDRDTADRWLSEAATRSIRLPDRYQWVHAHVLDTRITTAIEDDRPDRAEPLVNALETLAGRCEMRELVVRALVHRHDLGDRNALPAARLLGADIDNPALPTWSAAGAESTLARATAPRRRRRPRLGVSAVRVVSPAGRSAAPKGVAAQRV